ncbi:MAG: hypothetical protein HC808_15620 [Candidatus Competibacteraceae bacterium]|nr:hypothetical protein [Candidatus Competibacteraceae bacterium]
MAEYQLMALNNAEQQAWLTQSAKLDRAIRHWELASLPPSELRTLTDQYAGSMSLVDELNACSQALRSYDLTNPERLMVLANQTSVPDDYVTFQRIIGLYPLTGIPVRLGVARWHEEARELFAQPLKAVAVHGQLQRYQPPIAKTDVHVEFARLRRDALGFSQLDSEQLEALFNHHAPVWEIDVNGGFDLPGAPFWQGDNVPSVDTSKPVVYRYQSYTRWRKTPLLQLNYLIWFAERPRSGVLDILGGALDGLIWRVTLDKQGEPLVYDSIHPCGCYHQLFPRTALRVRPQALDLPESPLITQFAPRLWEGERLVVRLASGTHYIQRVYADSPTGTEYAWRDYHELYAVPTPDQDHRRSLFNAQGLVVGTERSERFLLWPMGVPSPGAMRERGRHATAFVGRRHFDDADLLEQIFEPAASTVTDSRMRAEAE